MSLLRNGQRIAFVETEATGILEYLVVLAALQCSPEFGISGEDSVPDGGGAGTPGHPHAKKMIHQISSFDVEPSEPRK